MLRLVLSLGFDFQGQPKTFSGFPILRCLALLKAALKLQNGAESVNRLCKNLRPYTPDKTCLSTIRAIEISESENENSLGNAPGAIGAPLTSLSNAATRSTSSGKRENHPYCSLKRSRGLAGVPQTVCPRRIIFSVGSTPACAPTIAPSSSVQCSRDAYLATEHHPGSYSALPEMPDLRGHDGVLADLNVVRRLAQGYRFSRPVAIWVWLERSAINRGVAANFHVVANFHAADLRKLDVLPSIENVSEPVAANDHARMYFHAISKPRAGVQRHAGMQASNPLPRARRGPGNKMHPPQCQYRLRLRLRSPRKVRREYSAPVAPSPQRSPSDEFPAAAQAAAPATLPPSRTRASGFSTSSTVFPRNVVAGRSDHADAPPTLALAQPAAPNPHKSHLQASRSPGSPHPRPARAHLREVFAPRYSASSPAV